MDSNDERPAVAHLSVVSYSRHLFQVSQTETFDIWFRQLNDLRSKARIARRLDRLAQGNPGDVRPIGKGLSELRLDTGPGYRVYYLQDGTTMILLLSGGSKSTQQKDIAKAHELAEQWKTQRRSWKVSE